MDPPVDVGTLSEKRTEPHIECVQLVCRLVDDVGTVAPSSLADVPLLYTWLTSDSFQTLCERVETTLS